MNWNEVWEMARVWYVKLAQFFLFESFVLYLFACVSAHAAVGLTDYIGFLDYCCHWVQE